MGSAAQGITEKLNTMPNPLRDMGQKVNQIINPKKKKHGQTVIPQVQQKVKERNIAARNALPEMPDLQMQRIMARREVARRNAQRGGRASTVLSQSDLLGG